MHGISIESPADIWFYENPMKIMKWRCLESLWWLLKLKKNWKTFLKINFKKIQKGNFEKKILKKIKFEEIFFKINFEKITWKENFWKENWKKYLK